MRRVLADATYVPISGRKGKGLEATLAALYITVLNDHLHKIACV